MFLRKILLLALSFVSVHAGCYRDDREIDPEWEDGDQYPEAMAFVDAICNPLGVSGYFEENEVKYKCRQVTNGKFSWKHEFMVEWMGEGPQALDDAECRRGLKAEIRGCEGGGESVIFDWKFRSDPNNGFCGN